MVAELITSLQNPRIKSLVRLRNRRERDRTQRFLIEGYRELRRAVDRRVSVEALFVCEELFLGSNEPQLIHDARSTGAEVIEVGADAFTKVSYRDRPEGLIAVAQQFETDLGSLESAPDALYLIVESIEKPGNLGTMLRTADAAGVTAVIVADPTTDPFNPNVVRASLGCLFTVPLGIAATGETLRWLEQSGIRTIATTPDASTLLWEADLTGAVAIVVGSEQYGLSDAWFEAAGDRVRIPMSGEADSLNAAMAAGVALFEAVRQRSR
ncbi:MAG: RNA methyltransferase [Acidimicrobiia bacterium]|nr:RNA methyltransferase [Acidimicrobiia bacterium]